MPLLNGQLSLHDVRDAEALCRRVLNGHLRRTKATLSANDYEDALAYLVSTAWELSVRFDPRRNSSFSKWAYNTLNRRVVDWYRGRFHRDQTQTSWYRRNNPNAPRHDPQQWRNVIFPDSLDAVGSDGDPLYQPAASDPRRHDPLVFALAALTGDPAADCSPELHAVLTGGRREDVGNLDLAPHRTHERTARRDRRTDAA